MKFAIGLLAVVGALALVLMAAERGAFSRFGTPGTAMALPGITLDDDDDDRRPVVTSVRSDGSAERAGIRTGDEIEAVDDHPVHDVATFRAALLADRGKRPVALHIRRGDALWWVALDTPATGAGARAAVMEVMNGAENPSD